MKGEKSKFLLWTSIFDTNWHCSMRLQTFTRLLLVPSSQRLIGQVAIGPTDGRKLRRWDLRVLEKQKLKPETSQVFPKPNTHQHTQEVRWLSRLLLWLFLHSKFFSHADDSPRTALWLVNQDVFLYLDWWPVDRAYMLHDFMLLFRNSNWLPPIGGEKNE